MRTLVLDAFWNKSLAAVRSLGAHGAFVGAGEWTRFAPAFFSRYCRRRLVYPSPSRRPDACLAALECELKAGGYDVLLPMELSTQLFVTEHRQALERFARIPFAEPAMTRRVHDKGQLTECAARLGIACPVTVCPTDPQDAEALAQTVSFPVLIKPRHSSGGRGIARVDRPEDFLPAYRAVHARFPAPIVQEYLPPGGDALGVAMLLNFSSEVRAAFVYRRLREYPIDGGPSTLRESVWAPDLQAIAGRLLSALRWVGVAMVEFKVDPRDGKAKVLEVNPRFWGSLHHAVLCGVDFPWLLCRLAVDGDVPAVTKYAVGVRSRCLFHGELMHFLRTPNRLHLRPPLWARGIPDDVLSAGDPLPAIARIVSLLTFAVSPDLRAVVRN